jgi:hypothetical protein
VVAVKGEQHKYAVLVCIEQPYLGRIVKALVQHRLWQQRRIVLALALAGNFVLLALLTDCKG